MSLEASLRSFFAKCKGRESFAPPGHFCFEIETSIGLQPLWVNFSEEPYLVVGFRVCDMTPELEVQLHGAMPPLVSELYGLVGFSESAATLTYVPIVPEESVETIFPLLLEKGCNEAQALRVALQALRAGEKSEEERAADDKIGEPQGRA